MQVFAYTWYLGRLTGMVLFSNFAEIGESKLWGSLQTTCAGQPTL